MFARNFTQAHPGPGHLSEIFHRQQADSFRASAANIAAPHPAEDLTAAATAFHVLAVDALELRG